MPTEKNDETEMLRRLVLLSKEVNETGGADCGLTTLSFQSVRYPNRNVWVDTDLAGDLSIDLEDWQNDEAWDNSVAHLTAPSMERAGAIIIAWLSGQSVDACRELHG
jgi:hypothetical protein